MADEAKAVTGRPADIPPANSTLAQRKAARLGVPAEPAEAKPEKAVAKKAAASKG
jgi:hypothetical protein